MVNSDVKRNNFFCAIFDYLFVITLVLDCNSIWLTIDSMSTWFQEFIGILMGLALVGRFMTTKRINRAFLTRGILWALFIAGYVLIYYAIDAIKSTSIIKQGISLLVVILYYYICGKDANRILFKYKKVVVIIATVSLLFWIIGSLFGLVGSTSTVFSGWNNSYVNSYYGIYFETQKSKFVNGVSFVRNSAIFVEAPMASLHFSIALLIELLLSSKPKKISCIVLTLSIFSSYSVTGIILVIVVLFLYFLMRRSKSNIKSLIKFFIIPIVLVVAISVFWNLISDKLDSASGFCRLDDFVAGFKAWMDYPIAGNGFKNDAAIIKYMNPSRMANKGFSNSPMKILSGVFIYSCLI